MKKDKEEMKIFYFLCDGKAWNRVCTETNAGLKHWLIDE
jgi:hypothetical protein